MSYPPNNNNNQFPYPAQAGASFYQQSPAQECATGFYSPVSSPTQHPFCPAPPPVPPPFHSPDAPQQQGIGIIGGPQQSCLYYQPQVPAMKPEIYAPSVRPYSNFNAQKDCEVLRKAMKGLGTDEAALISVLCHRSWQQRNEIERTYQQLFGKDLAKEIKSETSGNFRNVLKRLLKTPTKLAAYELHRAIAGVGTDEQCLIEIICTKTNEELQAISLEYINDYGKSLQEAVSGDTSGYFRRLLIALLSFNRPPDAPEPDWAGAAVDARALYDAGENRLGTDEARFIAVLAGRSYSQLRAIFDVYAREYKKDFVDVIKSEFSGDIAKALMVVIGAVRNRPAYFAERLHKAMFDGIATKDEMLLRIIVMHCDFDLGAVKNEYERFYSSRLSKDVHDKTSGDFRKSLLALIGPDCEGCH